LVTLGKKFDNAILVWEMSFIMQVPPAVRGSPPAGFKIDHESTPPTIGYAERGMNAT
jgi:hypothetical protein